MIDNYFTDTNIGIAYTFYPDKFHPSVKELIDGTNKNLIWSSFTKHEFKKKYCEINEKFDDFFQEIYILLINKEIYSYDFFEKTVLRNTVNIELDDYKKRKLLEMVWNNEKFNSFNLQSLLVLLDDLLYGFSDEKDNFIHKMQLFDCGNDNYKNYPEILNKLKENKVHKPDYIIVIDADVYSFIDPLIFLTADEKLFSKITDKCSNFLNIQDFELIKPLN